MNTVNSSGLSTKKANFSVEMENERKKFFLLTILFTLDGFLAVIVQVLLPDILKSVGFELLNPPSPSLNGLLGDYFGDVLLFSLILILVSMSTFSSEIDVNKQVYILLARPISRSTYYLTRTLIKSLGAFISFFVASIITYVFALGFFNALDPIKVLLSIGILSLSLCSIVATVIMFSSKFSTTTSGILGFLFLFGQIVISVVEPLKWFSPVSLANVWINILSDNPLNVIEIISSIFALSIWTLLPILIGWRFYLRRDL